MTRSWLGCSTFALVLIACSPSTGGLGTAFGDDDDSAGETDVTEPGSSGESGANDGATGDGDPSGDGDGDPGDGDPSGDGDPGPTGECGNGLIEEGEDCEGEDNGGVTCVDFGFAGGDMGCTGSCMHDVTQCWNDPCGNGVTDPGEDCDGPIMDDTNCIQFQLGPGQVTCTDQCTYDLSDCGVEGEGDGCGLINDCPDPQLYCHLFSCWDGSVGDDCGQDNQCLSGQCNGAPFGQCD